MPTKKISETSTNNSTMDKPKRGRKPAEKVEKIIEKSWSKLEEETQSSDDEVIKLKSNKIDSSDNSEVETNKIEDSSSEEDNIFTKTKFSQNKSIFAPKERFIANKLVSIADFDHDEYIKLDEDELSDYDTMDLIKVLMVRGISNNNPTLFSRAKNLLKELNFETEDIHKSFNSDTHRYSNDSFRGGRGGYRGDYRNDRKEHFQRNEKEQNVFEAGAGGGGDPRQFRRGGFRGGRGGFRGDKNN